jgi:hypothetical protein
MYIGSASSLQNVSHVQKAYSISDVRSTMLRLPTTATLPAEACKMGRRACDAVVRYACVRHELYIRMLPRVLNPLTPELNPSAQRCLARFFTGLF